MNEELLFESERTRITRIAAADGIGTVIRKELLGPRANRRARDELAILNLLASLPGVPHVVAGSGRSARPSTN